MRSHLRAVTVAVLLAMCFGCGSAQKAQTAAQSDSHLQHVAVAGMQGRELNVPPGFAVAVYARIRGARFMAVAPDGALLVTNPESGTVSIVRRNASGAEGAVATYAGGLKLPHGVVFHQLNGKPYLYVAESNGVVRFAYENGRAGARQQIVSGLPDASSPELHGAYGHELKNITFGPDGRLYVDLGSTCNVCISDTKSEPRRAAIYSYDENGRGAHLFAEGIRNGEGVRFFPGANDLWVTVNGRDDMPDPSNGKVYAQYVDDHPPDSLLLARDGGNYGWPFCQPSQDTSTGWLEMPFVRDLDMNHDGRVDCSKMDRHAMGLAAHSAALGLEFVPGSLVGDPHKTVALITFRGSWNRSRKTGYKVVYIPFDDQTHRPAQQTPVDLVTGWLDDATQKEWGRPVDAVAAADGSIYISDDTSGIVYRLYRTK